MHGFLFVCLFPKNIDCRVQVDNFNERREDVVEMRMYR